MQRANHAVPARHHCPSADFCLSRPHSLEPFVSGRSTLFLLTSSSDLQLLQSHRRALCSIANAANNGARCRLPPLCSCGLAALSLPSPHLRTCALVLLPPSPSWPAPDDAGGGVWLCALCFLTASTRVETASLAWETTLKKPISSRQQRAQRRALLAKLKKDYLAAVLALPTPNRSAVNSEMEDRRRDWRDLLHDQRSLDPRVAAGCKGAAGRPVCPPCDRFSISFWKMLKLVSETHLLQPVGTAHGV
jgi:hypothetical protein